MDTNKTFKNAIMFDCNKCYFKCSKHSDWLRHIGRPKHIRNTDGKIKNANYICQSCKKIYKHHSGLWKHAKKCMLSNNEFDNTNESSTINTIINDNEAFKKLILDVVKSNTELQKQTQDLHKQMLEVCQIGICGTNITHNNSHNKTFNLNFFLNEQCKDAMNIMDFVDTFKLDFTDLDNVGKLGYVEGISNIIIQKLNEMDIYKRPIHCSDLKRETTHVKDKGVWEKDNGNHDKLRLAIRHIAKKNSDMLNPWIEAHPHAQASAHYLNNVYMNYIMQAMGGRGDIDDNETKIIKKIAKVILIDK